MPETTVTRIRNKLRTIKDPELGIDIVRLGLVYGITALHGDATIRMTFTTPGCPLAPYMIGQIRRTVLEVNGVTRVQVEVVFDPPWTPEMISRMPSRAGAVKSRRNA